MEAAFEAQRRYLASLRDAAATRPEVHVNQLAALDREIALAADAADPAAYRAASGDLFELTRAARLDRMTALARVAALLDDPWHVRACAVEHAAALRATGPADWSECLEAGATEADAIRVEGADAMAAYERLGVAVVQWRADERKAEKADLRGSIDGALEVLTRADPGFGAAALEQGRYRWRTPWTRDGLTAFGAWLGELGAEGDGTPAGGDAAAAMAEIETAAAAWRDALANATPAPVAEEEATMASVVGAYIPLARLPAGDPVVEATRDAARALVAASQQATSPQEVIAEWTDKGLLLDLARAPIVAEARIMAARVNQWPEPLRAHQARALAEGVAAARTTTEVELIAAYMEGCFAIEAAWNRALMTGLLGPIRAACILGWDQGADAAASVKAAWDVTRTLTGAGGELVRLARVRSFFDVILAPADDTDAIGAQRGEAGHEVIGEARAYFSTARNQGKAPDTDEAHLVDGLRGLWGEVADGEAWSVRLWDFDVRLGDLMTQLAAPARPAVPGWPAEPGDAEL